MFDGDTILHTLFFVFLFVFLATLAGGPVRGAYMFYFMVFGPFIFILCVGFSWFQEYDEYCPAVVFWMLMTLVPGVCSFGVFAYRDSKLSKKERQARHYGGLGFDDEYVDADWEWEKERPWIIRHVGPGPRYCP